MVAEPRLMTAVEFAKLPEQTTPTELIDGEVIVSPAPTYWHNRIGFRLARRLSDIADSQGLGEWAMAPLDLFISTYNVYQPDALFFRAGHIPDLRQLPIMGIPEIVVEVISPSSRSRDRVRKRSAYADRNIAEYWIADPERAHLTISIRDATGAYIDHEVIESVIPAGVFAGAELDLAWVFAE
jgi:Uma2 family endonuclease